MKIYLAASFTRLKEIQAYTWPLITAGHEIVSAWLGQDPDAEDAAWENDPIRRVTAATADLAGVRRAHVVIIFTEPPDAITSHGGAMVEFGYALALQKKIIVVGPPQNCFIDYCLRGNVPHFSEWKTAAITAALKRM